MAYKGDFNLQQDPEKVDSSKINTGGLINLRLHDVYQKIYRYWENGRIDDLNFLLDIVWSEFYADATPEQRGTIEKHDENIVNFKNEKIRSGKDRIGLLRAHGKYVNEIKKKWLFLKTIEKKQGLGKAYVDEFEDDFD